MNDKIESNTLGDTLLIRPFMDMLFSKDIIDVGIDVSEIFFDSHLGEMSILKDVPIIKTFVSLGKTARSVQAWFEWKNQLAFLVQLNKGTIDRDGLGKRNEAYQNNEKWLYREVESLVVHMSKYTDIEKSRMQAELYIDLINGVITQNQFSEFLDVLVHLFMSDVPHLLEINQAERDVNFTGIDGEHFTDKIKTNFNISICRRLMSVGLLNQLHPMSFGFSLDNYFITSDTGKYLCEIIQRSLNIKKQK